MGVMAGSILVVSMTTTVVVVVSLVKTTGSVEEKRSRKLSSPSRTVSSITLTFTHIVPATVNVSTVFTAV